MTLETILPFALTEMAVALSPGPAVLLIVSQGARHGVRGSALGAAGIELGNLVWFALSALGLTALLLASATAFAIVKWTGAVYLVLLGLRLLRSRGTALVVRADAAAPRGRLVAQAFVTQMGNPKAMIFFGALLPQFVDLRADVALQFAALGLVEVAIEYPILLMYGFLADRGRKLASGQRALLWFERTAGGLLIAAGARLAVLARI